MRWRRILGSAVAVLTLAAGRAFAQDVGGTVMDSRTGRPLEGAQVAVSGGTRTVRTDGRGHFTITGVSGDVTLRVTMIGYRPQTVTAPAGKTDLRILISEQAVNLGEIVVTGNPEAAEKRTLGNSTATIHAADQQSFAPAPDVANLINSRAPGVVVIPGTGQIGAGPQVRIRGVNSFSLNGNPLIYIDGARVNNDVAQGISVQGFGSGISSRLNDIDPDNIESIEVIKGPAAATLYGTEATNGVIQIITKKGKAGPKPVIGLSIRQGTNWFMNPEGRIVQPLNMVDVATGGACSATSTCELRSWNPVRQEDSLFKAGVVDRPLFANGHLMGYGLTVSGGTDAIRYHVGTSFDADNGIEPTNDLRRLTTNANVAISGGAKYDVNVSFGFVKNKTNQAFEAGAGGIWFSTIFGDPALVPTPRRGYNGAPPEFQWGSRQANLSINRFTTSVTVNHRPTTWLSQKFTVGLDQTDQAAEQLNRFLPPEWVQFNPGAGALGLKFKGRRTVNYSTFDYSASARASLSDAIKSTTSFGAQYYRRRTDDLQAQKDQFVAPGLETVLSAAANPFAFEDFVENSTLGVYGQQQFGWKDKFYLTAAVRVDNNSAFGDNFDLIAYPKVSGSFIAKENGEGLINTLKLRAAYGQAGQQPVAFAALRSWQAVTGGDGAGAPIPQFVGNPDLKPERAAEVELGADAGFLDDRLGFALTAYTKTTRDAILLKNLAPSQGFAGTQFVNVGAVRNRGLEAEIYGRPIERQNFSLDARFSMSYVKNKVTDLGSNADGTPIRSLGNGQATLGDPVNARYSRRVVSATYNATTKRAENVLCDDGKGGAGVACATAPLVNTGQFDPTTEGSLSLTATFWNRFRVYGLADFKAGNVHTDNNRRALCQVFLRCDENFNPQDYDPKLIAEIQSAGTVTSFSASKADFIKLRELSVSYQLPRRIAKWFRASDGNVSLSGRNLHTWTGYSGLDPESYFLTQQFVRLEQDQTPPLASVNVSVNLTF